MDITTLLKEKKLKKTNARLAIMSILEKSASPLGEKEIKKEMDGDYDRITFYRTVQTLIEAKIIHRIIIDSTTIKYAFTREITSESIKHMHIHFYCKKCHTTQCLEEIAIQDYTLPRGYIQEECEVLIKGICKNCK